MENYDFTFISKELKNGEAGYADIFYKYYLEKIVVLEIGKTTEGYIYDKNTKLYKELCYEIMTGEISKTLQKIVDMMIDQVKAVAVLDEKEKVKKCQEFERLKSNFGKGATTRAIYTALLNKYYRPDLKLSFKNDVDIIPLSGGKVINLKTGEIKDRNDTHYYTVEQTCKYLGYGTQYSPKTEEFFKKLCCGNKDKQEFLRMIMGSSITSDTKMKCFFILFGSKGNNGKSTLLSIMDKIFKEQSVALNPDFIFAENADKVSDKDFGTLLGKTIATCIEPAHHYIHDPIIKLLTGGDSVNGKKLWKDPISFVPTVKIFIALNNIIRIKDNEIMKKRTRVINFDAEFVENPTKPNQYKGDRDIETKFLSEWRDDFFTYIVNGAIDYWRLGEGKRGLHQPESLEHERTSYFKGMDYIGKALSENFVFTHNKNDKVSKPYINTAYHNICLENGKPFNLGKFTDYMNDKFGEAKKTDGVYCYSGIREKTDEEKDEVANLFKGKQEETTPEPNYKTMYEELLKKYESLEKEMTQLKQTTQKPVEKPKQEKQPASPLSSLRAELEEITKTETASITVKEQDTKDDFINIALQFKKQKEQKLKEKKEHDCLMGNNEPVKKLKNKSKLILNPFSDDEE